MVVPVIATLALPQGAPFRGMVHDATIQVQKDPFDGMQAYPVSGSEGRSFLVSVSGRAPTNDLMVHEISREGQVRPVVKLTRPGFHYFAAQTFQLKDGGFWIVANVSRVNERAVPDRQAEIFRIDGSGKVLSKEILDNDLRFEKAILNAQETLFLASQAPRQDLHLTKISNGGKVEWTKPVVDSKNSRFSSITSLTDGTLVLFADRQGTSQTSADIFMGRMDAKTGLSASGYQTIPNLRHLLPVATSNGTIAYTAIQMQDGKSEFLVCSVPALHPTKRVPLAVDKTSTVKAMISHPKRGVYVGVNTMDGPVRESIVVRISYGGKVHETTPATYQGAGATTTAFVMDRYEDIYVAGSTASGAFQTKLGRPSGVLFHQFFNLGMTGDGSGVNLTVNDDTGEVFLFSQGRLAKYSQSPLLYPKTYEIEADTIVKDKNCLENDRYVKFGQVVLVTGPTKGILKLGVDGKYTYTPKKGFVGVDKFTYRVNRGTVTSYSGQVTFKIMSKPN